MIKSINPSLLIALICAISGFVFNARAVETPMNYAFVSNGLYEGTLKADTDYFIESKFGTVTYVDQPGKRFFIQDLVGAIEIDCTRLTGDIPVKVGDKFKKFTVLHSGGKLYLTDNSYDAADITEATPKQPTPYLLADIQFDPQSYWNKLVTIENVTFGEAGGAFGATPTQVTDAAGKSIGVLSFDGTDLIGATIPATGSVTGLLVGKNGELISPRGIDDVEGASAAAATALEITQQLDFHEVAAPIGVDTRFATFTVVARDLEKPVDIWLSGANRAMFNLSADNIPAGSGTYEIVVTYHPTAIGSHKCMVTFDAVPTELSGSYSLSAKAYDPEHLPEISSSSVAESFSAAPGATDKKTITIQSANMFDYGSVVVESQSTPGTFIINNSSLYPNIACALTIEFKPKTAGTYSATIKASAPKAQDLYIQLTGVSQGETPQEQTEGGSLNLDTSSPVALLIENFDNVDHNKPLAIAGWSNVAVKGSRAWWGYNFTGEAPNGAAKVTAYDSKMAVGSDTPCEMLLVTPALDFKNAGSKIFTCRVMGDYLPSEGECTPIEVLYIEDADYMAPLEGMNIPVTADAGGQWIDYVVDFDGLDLADVFFMGFRLKSQRGRDNSSVYYVDNVSWGRTDVPQIKADVFNLVLEGTVGSTTMSDAIAIAGLNLSEAITIKVTGPNASKFGTNVKSLDIEGGALSVSFSPEQEGVHEAYVELSSAGAPTLSIHVEALAKKESGVGSVDAYSIAPSAIYNLQGIRVNANRSDLPAGLYIIDGRLVKR